MAVLFDKFIKQIERIFDSLPKSTEWRSFYSNDLPLVTDVDPKVRDWAVKLKLNKSQAKALNELLSKFTSCKECCRSSLTRFWVARVKVEELLQST